MVAARKSYQLQIQALRNDKGGNPTPATLRQINDLEAKMKGASKRQTMRRKTEERAKARQERGKAGGYQDKGKDSPHGPRQPDTAGDASGNDGYDDVWEGFESPDPEMMDRDNDPEQFRLTTPEPTISSSFKDKRSGYEGGKGDCCCGVGECAGGGVEGDAEIWRGEA